MLFTVCVCVLSLFFPFGLQLQPKCQFCYYGDWRGSVFSASYSEICVAIETGLSFSVTFVSLPAFPWSDSASPPVLSLEHVESPFIWSKEDVGVASAWPFRSGSVLIGPSGAERTPSAIASCYWSENDQRYPNGFIQLKIDGNIGTALTLCRSVMVLSSKVCLSVRDSSVSRMDCLGCIPLS